MCNFKKGILIMKNLSNIKATLAVSMLLSASLFSMESGSCFEVMEEAMASVRPVNTFAGDVGPIEGKRNLNYQASLLCDLRKLAAEVDARKQALKTATENRDTVFSFFNTGKTRKSSVESPTLEKTLHALHCAEIHTSKEPSVRTAYQEIESRRLQILQLEAEQRNLEVADESRKEERYNLVKTLKHQLSHLSKDAKDAYPFHDKRVLSIGAEKTKKSRGFTVEYTANDKPKINVDKFLGAIQEVDAKDCHGKYQQTFNELERQAEEVKQTQLAIKENNKRGNYFAEKMSPIKKQLCILRHEDKKANESMIFNVIPASGKGLSLKRVNETKRAHDDLVTYRRKPYSATEETTIAATSCVLESLRTQCTEVKYHQLLMTAQDRNVTEKAASYEIAKARFTEALRNSDNPNVRKANLDNKLAKVKLMKAPEARIYVERKIEKLNYEIATADDRRVEPAAAPQSWFAKCANYFSK